MMMTMLRKTVNHPYHFLDPDKPCSLTEKKENLFRCSGKFEFLQRAVPRLCRAGHKVLIFTQMTHTLDMIGSLMRDEGITYANIDGRMSFNRRKEVVARLRNDDSLMVILLSIRAGNVGLNLQATDTVILFDSDWNPQMDLQAMDRVHRIGQTRPCLIIRLMTPTSLDLGLLRRTGNKLEIEQKVIGLGEFHQHRRGASSKESSSTGQKEALLRDLVREARLKGASASKMDMEPTTLIETNRKLARAPEEQAAWDAEDEALLGPVADDDGVTERLERCGRLLSADEVPRGRLANLERCGAGAQGRRPTKKRRIWNL